MRKIIAKIVLPAVLVGALIGGVSMESADAGVPRDSWTQKVNTSYGYKYRSCHYNAHGGVICTKWRYNFSG